MSIDFLPPIPVMASKKSIEKLAEAIADRLDFHRNGSLEDVVCSTGGRIEVGSSGSGDSDSGSIIANSLNDYTIFLSLHTSRQRDRFTIAHELGHLFLHLPQIKKTSSDLGMRATRWVDESNDEQRRAEWEANWFAAAFLMPEERFRSIMKSGGLSLAQTEFDVSRSAAEIRARSLEII